MKEKQEQVQDPRAAEYAKRFEQGGVRVVALSDALKLPAKERRDERRETLRAVK